MKNSSLDSFDRLLRIQDAINQILKFSSEKSRETFITDSLLHSAILFQFSVIGEAVLHIDTNILDKYNYGWYKIRAFRNLISHEYFNIKLEAVWEIIVNDLSELKQIIETILSNEF